MNVVLETVIQVEEVVLDKVISSSFIATGRKKRSCWVLDVMGVGKTIMRGPRIGGSQKRQRAKKKSPLFLKPVCVGFCVA